MRLNYPFELLLKLLRHLARESQSLFSLVSEPSSLIEQDGAEYLRAGIEKFSYALHHGECFHRGWSIFVIAGCFHAEIDTIRLLTFIGGCKMSTISGIADANIRIFGSCCGFSTLLIDIVLLDADADPTLLPPCPSSALTPTSLSASSSTSSVEAVSSYTSTTYIMVLGSPPLASPYLPSLTLAAYSQEDRVILESGAAALIISCSSQK